MRCLQVVLFLVLTTVAGVASPVLKVTATRVHDTSYVVEISNVSSNDVLFQIGMCINNGSYISYGGVTLHFRDASGATYLLGVRKDHPSAIGGRMDPLYMPLLRDAAVRISITEAQYRFDGIPAKELGAFQAVLTAPEMDVSDLPIEYMNARVVSGKFESMEYAIK